MKKIGIIGAPGSGKTTFASGLFYHLKVMGKKAEWVPEIIKYKVYQQEDFSQPGFDFQNNMEQMVFEDIFEGQDFDFLICEAPLCNGFFYASFYNKAGEVGALREIARSRITGYDVLVFMKMLPEQDYSTFGRYESEEQARQFENLLPRLLAELEYPHSIIEVSHNTDIPEFIKTQLLSDLVLPLPFGDI